MPTIALSLELKNIKKIYLYTGTNGRAGCACNCPMCILGDSLSIEKYQGTIEQIHEILAVLPNLRQAFLMGNPDPCVDTDFCNSAARVFQAHDIKVFFQTSGIGGVKTLEKLFDGLDPKRTAVNFSLDSLDNEKLAILKGTRNYTVEKITECFDWCKERGVVTTVMPTVWNINMDEDWFAFEKYCREHGVGTVLIQFGAMNEKGRKTVVPVPEIKVREIMEKYKKFNGWVQQMLLNDEEFKIYKDNFKTPCSNLNGHSIFIVLDKKGLRATSCTTIFDDVKTVFNEHIIKVDDMAIPVLLEKKISACQILGKAYGLSDENYHCACRFYWLYGSLDKYKDK